MQQDIFVGRDSVIAKTIDFLQSLTSCEIESSPRFLTVQGPGGIGKTKLLIKLRQKASEELGFETTEVIDLKATAHRSSISLLQTIATSLENASCDDNQNTFTKFFEAIELYNSAKAQEKHALYEPTIQTFINCCKDRSRIAPQLILLDTFESIQETEFSNWLLALLAHLGGRIGIIIAGRNPVPITDVEVFPVMLDKLSIDEIGELGRKLFERRDIGIDYDLTSEVIKGIEYLTDGRPILVVLAFEWILENVEPEKIISIPKEHFEAEIVSYLKNLENDQDIAVVMMATIDRRLTTRIISLLTKWDVSKCIEVCEKLARFAFVKIIEQLEENLYTLHDEMFRLVSSYVDFPTVVKNNWREAVVNEYYDREIKNTFVPQTKQTLIAEKLYYQLHYSPEDAINYFDQQMHIAVESYEFEFCELLLSEVYRLSLNLNDMHHRVVELNYAEMLVKSYQPFQAKSLFDKLILKFDAEHETEYFSRVITGLGACIANGSTVVEANMTEAINLLKRSLEICEEKGLNERVAVISHQIGSLYDLLGFNDQTLYYYTQSNQLARQIGNYRLITATLDEIGKLRLKRYEVPQALQLFQESLQIKEQTGDNKGMRASYHLLGNAYRDADNFTEALKWYDLAEKARKTVSDDWGLCQLYSDIAWLYLLSKDWDKTVQYLDKEYYELAIPRNFGREIADAEHSYYHVKLETEGLDAALPWIEKAFKNAETYSNTFIYLDAALHLIEAAYEKGEYHKILTYYEKMDELDKKGCGYRMFKGRAINIMGDLAYDQKNYQDAVDKWQEGYTIVAIHGRSRSATVTFHDYLQQRYQRITESLKQCGLQRIKQLQRHWEETILDEGKPETLAQEYPAMLGILKCAEGDVYYEGSMYEDALKSWFLGVIDIALHMVIQPKSAAVLSLPEHFDLRKTEIEYTLNFLGSDIIRKLKNGLDTQKTWNLSRCQLWHFAELVASFQGLFLSS